MLTLLKGNKMRLSNGIEVEVLDDTTVEFTKLIDSKLYKVKARVKTTKMLLIVASGFGSYTDDEFKAEAILTSS